MTKLVIPALIGVLSACTLSSCLIQQAVKLVVRDAYPGTRPPKVITEVNGKPSPQAKWLKVDPNDLPPSGSLSGKSPRQAADGLPYGFTSEYSNTVVSPYHPNYILDYTGVAPETRVWDPYTHKPFYIPRTYTVN